MAMINTSVFHYSNILRRMTSRSCFSVYYTRCYSQNVKDYYDILGVQKNASKRQIRAAFLHLSKQHHPDVNPELKGSSEEFKKISEAYKVLSNSKKKEEYDYNQLRRKDPSMPPVDDIHARYYQDGTIYRGSKKRMDTGYTNRQVVAIVVAISTVAAIAQVIRVRMVARKRAERQAEAEEQAVEHMERIRNNVFVSRSRLLQQLMEAKEADKLAKKKSNTDQKSPSDTDPESLVDIAPTQ